MHNKSNHKALTIQQQARLSKSNVFVFWTAIILKRSAYS